MDNLDDFLKGQEQPEAAVEPAAEPETPTAPEATPEPVAEEPKGPERDEKGRFKPKGEEAAPPAAEEHAIPVKALQEERRKRQELEAELERLRTQQPPQPEPDVFEDPQGFGQHVTSVATDQAVQIASLNARLDMSEMMVAQAHQDFGEMKPKILEFMEANPGLRQQILTDMHPWNKAYQLVKNHERMQQLAAVDVADLEAKLREQIKAELSAKPADPPAVPETLADAQSARGGSGQALNIPTLDEILRR